MINDLVDNFPEDSRNDLLAEYQSFFTNDLQQKLMSESMCHAALPKCAQFSVQDFCVKSDFDSVYFGRKKCRLVIHSNIFYLRSTLQHQSLFFVQYL